MREVLCTGHTTTFGRSLRSLLAYINDVTSNSTACEFQEEKADAGGEHEVKHLRTQESHPNDSTALDLRIRDLRILDVNFHPSNVYSIIVRKHSVLLSLDPFKAVVMADRIIILVPPQKMAEENMDRILKMFENNFQCKYYIINTQFIQTHFATFVPMT